jgi:hypothetical protein
MRTIEPIDFTDMTGNGEDGFSARFSFRLDGVIRTYRVSVSGTTAASAGLTMGTPGETRERAMLAMRKAAEQRVKDDPRRDILTMETLRLEKRDVEPFFKA